MQTFAAVLVASASVAQALVPRSGSCCFKLHGSGAGASSGVSGQVGQLGDGQNRIGGNYPAGTYCIGSNGGLTDGKGRGCILTPPTTQFQCDQGATATPGFSVGSNGQLSQNGNSKYYACPTGDQGSYNIYTSTVDKNNCVAITLTADNCGVAKQAPAPAPKPVAPAKSCPANLNGPYEFPHLIVPVNSAHASQAYGTSLNGEVSSTVSSLFNFDIPASDKGKTCSLVFLFPQQSQLTTSSFTTSGSGGIDFSSLNSAATQQTTFANAPSVKQDFGVKNVSPGNSYTITSFPCPAGQKIGFKAKSAGTSLKYFQDFNPSPIGLYITVC